MNDPERWLSGRGDGEALERDLLASLRSIDPPEGAKDVAWEAIAARAAGAAVAGTVAASGLRGAAVALKGAATKIALGVVFAGAAVGGTAAWVHVRSASRVVPDVSRIVETPATVAPPTDAPEALASVPVLTTPAAPSSMRSPPDHTRVDRLGAESALLTEARAELRRGDVTAAQATLARIQAAFPNGVLGQEREVLAIEVLAGSGRTDAARRRARAFIDAHPESPHSTTLGHLLDP